MATKYYLKPDAGVVARGVDRLVYLGDGFLAFMTCIFSVLATAVAFLAVVSDGPIQFLLLLIMPALWLLARHISIRTTKEIDHGRNDDFVSASKSYNLLEGEDRKVAKPLIHEIYNHSGNKHIGYSQWECDYCDERRKVITSLVVVKRPDDDAALERAKQYLEFRRA